jgi:hypothetical protein
MNDNDNDDADNEGQANFYGAYATASECIIRLYFGESLRSDATQEEHPIYSSYIEAIMSNLESSDPCIELMFWMFRYRVIAVAAAEVGGELAENAYAPEAIAEAAENRTCIAQAELALGENAPNARYFPEQRILPVLAELQHPPSTPEEVQRELYAECATMLKNHWELVTRVAERIMGDEVPHLPSDVITLVHDKYWEDSPEIRRLVVTAMQANPPL